MTYTGLELMIRIGLRQQLDTATAIKAGAVQVTVVRISSALPANRGEVDLAASLIDSLDIDYQPVAAA